ncbi:MAG: hypothetical protein RL095_3468 [Verrucomicrobiota bacterium]|jgi:3',5'-cyclic AMP phosphodiesterase CpdA
MIRKLLLSAFLMASCSSAPETLRFGAMTDCQYCAKPTAGRRHYDESPRKLQVAMEEFQRLHPEWLVHLGDFIDDRYESFEPVLKICRAFDFHIYHVLGNHDFSVEDKFKDGIHKLLSMPAPYYSWATKGWRFIALDGNELSLYAHPKGSPKDLESRAYYAQLNPKPATYNGAIGPQQIAWLRLQLEAAGKKGEKVILLCHFPLLPIAADNLWNAPEMLSLIDQHPCVKAWLNGHNHHGGYAERKGVHYLTFQGMVDTPDNSFALVEIDEKSIRIRGYGREPDRDLLIKK